MDPVTCPVGHVSPSPVWKVCGLGTSVMVRGGSSSVAGSESVDQNVILPAGSDIADGKFEIINLIATGATAAVYRARHRLLGMEVALKILNFSLLGRDDCVARFQKEARVSSQLFHTNLAKLIAFGTLDDGRPFLAAELVEGRTLAEILSAAEPMSSERAITLFMQICDGLGALHHHGIVHRDLKPSNVIIQTDENAAERVKLIDLGLIKELQSSDPKITKTGQILGSAAYMSPEQCRSGQIDERSDIYSLGCLMYECLAGVPPFGDDAGFVTMTKQASESAPPIDQFRKAQLLPGLQDIVAVAMEKEPSKRWQSASELKEHLRRCLDGELSARFLQPSQKEKARESRSKIAIIGALLCVILLVGFLAAINNRAIKKPLVRRNESNQSSSDAISKADAKLIQIAMSKASRMAQNATLAGEGQVQDTLHHPEVMRKYYELWLENHPKAFLPDRARAEYRAFVFANAMANQKLANDHGSKAEKYYMQLLNAKVAEISRLSSKSSYESMVGADVAAGYARALADLANLSGKHAEAAKYQVRRWQLLRTTQPSGAEETTIVDLEIAKALKGLNAFSEEQQVLKSMKFGPASKPFAEIAMAESPDLEAFSGGDQDPQNRIASLSFLQANQLALGNEDAAAKIWKFMVLYAQSVKPPWERAQAYGTLASVAQRNRQYSLACKFADTALSSLDQSPEQDRKEWVEQKLSVLLVAGCSAQLMNDVGLAARYYSQCLPYARHRRHGYLVMQCLRNYFMTAISLRDEKLCDQLIGSYEQIATSAEDRVQDYLVLSYMRLKRLSLDTGDHQKAYGKIVDEVIATPTQSREACLAEKIAIARALLEMQQLQLSEKLLQHVIESTNPHVILRADYIQSAKIILALVKCELKEYAETLAILGQINRVFTDEHLAPEYQMLRALTGFRASLALGKMDLSKHFAEQGEMVLTMECPPEQKASFLMMVAPYYFSLGQETKGLACARQALDLTKEYCAATSAKVAVPELVLAKLLAKNNRAESRSLFEDALRISKTAKDAPPDGQLAALVATEYDAVKKRWQNKE